jgi:hypothetical protein
MSIARGTQPVSFDLPVTSLVLQPLPGGHIELVAASREIARDELGIGPQ